MNKIKSLAFNYGLFAVLSIALILGGAFFEPSYAKDKNDDKIIKLAVTNLKVYEDTAKAWAKEVEKLGYKLDYRIISGVQLNESLERGEVFANYHQHTPALTEFNRTHKGHIVPAFPVFTDRSGLFSLKYKNIKDLPVGAKIVIPADVGNNFRTFQILADAGLIKIKSGVPSESVSKADIIDNPKKFKFVEVEYELLERTIKDADAGFLYATNAAQIGLDFNKDVLWPEPEKFWAADIIAVREENLKSPKTEILKKAYYTEAVKQALKDAFDGREILLPAW
ncbi:MAG: hypothetical protein LBL00_07495 [Endomicrobium sp.]|nr:hypothetical protein [Endomicrobium sp.]